MSENMKKFLELVSKDETLKQKMQTFKGMEPKDAISAGIALAKELGIELGEADFVREKSGGELADDELGAVSGGARLAEYRIANRWDDAIDWDFVFSDQEGTNGGFCHFAGC